ncbi:MAG: molybdopterin oxidoreductase, iron-sulfur binding subunit [Verrucomicrobiales bacterium]|nr:molybdopterin oxidoreductase, iron-sulfur binding subunit [Verrucomicrobiales bacterium]
MKRDVWRSLDELEDSKEFREWLHREFPPLASEMLGDVDRRRFLKLMGASFALAGLTACTGQPIEKIIPYVKQPEELVPGRPLYFATALTLEGYARGVLVESHEGRPTKIEGNPEHPVSKGASDLFMQAEILSLYDPDRSKRVTNDGRIATWDDFLTVATTERKKWRENSGAGLRLLTGNITSPTLLSQIETLLREFPSAKWHTYEPLAPVSAAPLYDLTKADVILAIEDDFLGPGPAQLIYVRDFSSRRKTLEGAKNFNRLYVAESSPTLTGARADHRFPLSPRRLTEFAQLVIERKGESAATAAIIEDLKRHPGRSLVLAGDSLPQSVRDSARNWNRPLQVAEPPASNGRPLSELKEDLREGRVDAVVILGGNPVYDAPVDFEFEKALVGVPLRIRLGLYEDETSEVCQWHIPEAHPLETWSDARAIDGTTTIVQPLIEPLYGGKSAHELIAALAGNPVVESYEIVRQYWLSRLSNDEFEKHWRKAVHDGIVPMQIPSSATQLPSAPQEHSSDGVLEISFKPGPSVRGGRYSNNAWLQELPQPFTKITWDNAALISWTTAQRFHLENEEIVDLTYRGRSVRAPVWILPGQSDDCVTVHLGYGRRRAGLVGNGVGFDAYGLRTSDAPWGSGGVEIAKTGHKHKFASTQHHQATEGRDLVRCGTIVEFRQNPERIARGAEPEPAANETLYPPVPTKSYAWGMAIDLGACVGCNVCTIACQAENNIPVVGREQVARGRVMHWIRVDNYFEGPAASPRIHFQPVPCMHCENAPCELVCPVAATVHSSDGLNQMVYNRCIGTRYCSNNCPYKVRRFNFLEFQRNPFESAPVLKLLRNPDVTIRTRGVMEKCTYCVQRIQRSRITAEKENRTIRDGESTPACAQACPAEAIIFGDINDPKSRVSRYKASPLNYSLLGELNARPRTTYLAGLRNTNQEVEKQ